MSATSPLVVVIDDDASVRESLPELVRELGYRVRAFASAEGFLESGELASTRCLLLDVKLPGMSGPELQRKLKRMQSRIQIVFITANRDETIRRRLLEEGAVTCLFKPFDEAVLRGAISAALRAA